MSELCYKIKKFFKKRFVKFCLFVFVLSHCYLLIAQHVLYDFEYEHALTICTFLVERGPDSLYMADYAWYLYRVRVYIEVSVLLVVFAMLCYSTYWFVNYLPEFAMSIPAMLERARIAVDECLAPWERFVFKCIRRVLLLIFIIFGYLLKFFFWALVFDWIRFFNIAFCLFLTGFFPKTSGMIIISCMFALRMFVLILCFVAFYVCFFFVFFKPISKLAKRIHNSPRINAIIFCAGALLNQYFFESELFCGCVLFWKKHGGAILTAILCCFLAYVGIVADSFFYDHTGIIGFVVCILRNFGFISNYNSFILSLVMLKIVFLTLCKLLYNLLPFYLIYRFFLFFFWSYPQLLDYVLNYLLSISYLIHYLYCSVSSKQNLYFRFFNNKNTIFKRLVLMLNLLLAQPVQLLKQLTARMLRGFVDIRAISGVSKFSSVFQILFIILLIVMIIITLVLVVL